MSNTAPVFAGLSSLLLGDEPIDLGKGILLSKTFAHVMSTITLAFNEPREPGQHHPGPWRATSSGSAFDVKAQLMIPATYNHHSMDRYEVAKTIVCLLRLWSDPEITMTLISKHPFASLAELPENGEMVAAAVEVQRRHFRLQLADHTKTLESLSWVRENWETALDLKAASAEFALALTVFEIGQFIPNTAMTLVALWGALEAIFSPSTGELKFRVSALIAAYLRPPGAGRLALQQRVAKLYDKRSAAAHGKPKHAPNDLLETFELIREVLITMVRRKKVPTKEELDRMLFGAPENK